MQNKLILASTSLILYFLIANVHAEEFVKTSDYDFMVCGSSLEQSKEYLGVSWSWEEMYGICTKLLTDGKILIDRNDQRDILIIWANIGDTVKIPLPQPDTLGQ